MKTVQDWGFISKEQPKDQGLVKPKLQENKIFHALTSAYENNQQHEICGATENIVRREKELCELALADLKRLSEGKGEADPTLKLVMDHYRTRLTLAQEKEARINQLSEDSRKMAEEYRKKTQELADVKRNLMESQGKLRELAKTTEKLIKKEEELRFIESNLRTELDRNKQDIINGLYEIVADLPEGGFPATPGPVAGAVAPSAAAPRPAAPPPAREADAPLFSQAPAGALPAPGREAEDSRPFHQALFRSASDNASGGEARSENAALREVAWTRDVPRAQGVGGGHAAAPEPAAPMFRDEPAAPVVAEPKPAPVHLPPPAVGPVILKPGDLQEKAARLKMFEPGKTLCAKSMVKNADGEVISEYFYSPSQQKEARQYIFNALFAVSSLLTLKSRDEDLFQDRMEMIFTDLLSRLEHSRNIHLESFLGEELSLETLDRILGLPRKERGPQFETLAARILSRIESIGPARAGLIDQQFKTIPKADFPPGKGIAA